MSKHNNGGGDLSNIMRWHGEGARIECVIEFDDAQAHVINLAKNLGLEFDGDAVKRLIVRAACTAVQGMINHAKLTMRPPDPRKEAMRVARLRARRAMYLDAIRRIDANLDDDPVQP